MIRGSDPALRDQIVAIGAHYDGLGIGTPVGTDSINNGADDDASGVTAVLLIARLRSGPGAIIVPAKPPSATGAAGFTIGSVMRKEGGWPVAR